jgi:hypothetical protein
LPTAGSIRSCTACGCVLGMTFADAGLVAALTTWAVSSTLVLAKIVVIVTVLRRSAIVTSDKRLIALIIAGLGIGALAVVALIHLCHSVTCYWLASGLLRGRSS